MVERRVGERHRRRVAGSPSCSQCGGSGSFRPRLATDPVSLTPTTEASFGFSQSGWCPRCDGTGLLRPETPTPAGPAGPAEPRRLDPMAAAAFGLTLLAPFTVVSAIGGAILGYAARRRCWHSGDRGAGLAEAGLVGAVPAAFLAVLGIPALINALQTVGG